MFRECDVVIWDVQLPLTSGGGLAGIDVSDNDDVDMSLFLTIERVDMSAIFVDIKCLRKAATPDRVAPSLRGFDLLTP